MLYTPSTLWFKCSIKFGGIHPNLLLTKMSVKAVVEFPQGGMN